MTDKAATHTTVLKACPIGMKPLTKRTIMGSQNSRAVCHTFERMSRDALFVDSDFMPRRIAARIIAMGGLPYDSDPTRYIRHVSPHTPLDSADGSMSLPSMRTDGEPRKRISCARAGESTSMNSTVASAASNCTACRTSSRVLSAFGHPGKLNISICTLFSKLARTARRADRGCLGRGAARSSPPKVGASSNPERVEGCRSTIVRVRKAGRHPRPIQAYAAPFHRRPPASRCRPNTDARAGQ
jgi:hypothetical protein